MTFKEKQNRWWGMDEIAKVIGIEISSKKIHPIIKLLWAYKVGDEQARESIMKDVDCALSNLNNLEPDHNYYEH